MKKVLFILLVAFFAANSVLADGYHRKSSGKHCDGCGFFCSVGKGLLFVVKLPFRTVLSATAGTYGLVTDADFDGFADGYNLI